MSKIHKNLSWASIKKKYDNKCLRCGRSEPEIELVEDHVLPISKKGSLDNENIQPLCFKCNQIKHDKFIDYREGSPYKNKPNLLKRKRRTFKVIDNFDEIGKKQFTKLALSAFYYQQEKL